VDCCLFQIKENKAYIGSISLDNNRLEIEIHVSTRAGARKTCARCRDFRQAAQ
jgi:hypothetical protein